MKRLIIILFIMLPFGTFAQSILDSISRIQDLVIDYKNTPYETLINFDKNKRKEVYSRFNVDLSKLNSFKIIEGYNPTSGNLYGMFWIKRKGYSYFVKVDSKGQVIIKTKVIWNYSNNKIFNSQMLKDIENWNMDKNVLSKVHDGLYLIAVKVCKVSNLCSDIKIKDFYEY